MGANAQTTVPLFVAGNVLTAAQQNISAGTGIPVFATTTTRDAAFGGSNKTLAQGQFAYIEASGTLQVYTGSAWINSNGLQLISTTTIGSAVASVAVTGAFSSTYDAYKIIVTGGTASTTDNNMRYINTGSTTGY